MKLGPVGCRAGERKDRPVFPLNPGLKLYVLCMNERLMAEECMEIITFHVVAAESIAFLFTTERFSSYLRRFSVLL